MSSPTDEHPPAKPTRGLKARAWQVVSFILAFLTPIAFIYELQDAYEKGVKLEKPGDPRTFTGRMEYALNSQLAELQLVDSGGLGSTYYTTLQSNKCNWFFQCHQVQVYEPPNLLGVQPIITLSPGFQDAMGKGRAMALAPTTPTPPNPSPKVVLPSSIKFHEMSGSAVPASSNGVTLQSLLPGGNGASTPIPGQSDADRETLAKVEQNLKTQQNSLSLQGSSGASGLSSPPKPITNPAPIPAPRLPQAMTLPDLSHVPLSTSPAVEIVPTLPAVFWHKGPIWLPTFNTILGTPHAFLQMLIKIHDAGVWAMAIYLCGTLIWIALWVRKMPVMLYLAFVFGPVSIPLIVSLVQVLCEGLLKLGLVGCAVAAGLMALLPSTLLTLVVGLHHSLKTPRELLEVVEHLRG